MDYYVADLLAALGDQLANTVIIFAGDNGTQDRDPDSRQSIDDRIGDDKSTSSVGGVHIPMIVADGGLMTGGPARYVSQAPRSLTGPVHIVDVYDTVLDIAGVSPPTSNDSISFAAKLRGGEGPSRTHPFSQMFLLGAVPVGASTCDPAYEYKLTCEALTQGFTPVDRQGQPVDTPVYDYVFSRLVPEPGIPGSFLDERIDALAPNDDGSFRITNPDHEAKILELYEVLRTQYLDSNKTPFPIIESGDDQVKIQSGTVQHGPQWRLYSGSGERKHHAEVTFDQPFAEPPTVVVSIEKLDIMQTGANHRVWVKAQNVRAEGFTLEFMTWADTHIWAVGANWIAYGK